MLCGNWGCGTSASLSIAPPLFKTLAENVRTSCEFREEDSILLEDLDQPDVWPPSQEAPGNFTATNALQEAAAPARNKKGTSSSGQAAELALATVPVTLARSGARVASTVPTRALTKPKSSRQPLRVINVTEHFWNEEESQEADTAAAFEVGPAASASEVIVMGSLPPPPKKRMQPSDRLLRHYQSAQETSSAAYPIPSVPKPHAVAPTSPAHPYFGNETGQAHADSQAQAPTQKQAGGQPQSRNGVVDQQEVGDYHSYRRYETSPRMSGLGVPEWCRSPTTGSPRASAAAAAAPAQQQEFDLHAGRAPRPSSHLTDDLLSPRVSMFDSNRQSLPSTLPVVPPKSGEADMPMRDVAPDGFPLPPQRPCRDATTTVAGYQQLPVPPPRRRRNRPSSQIRSSPDERVVKSPMGSPTPGARMIYNSRQGGFPPPGARPGTAPVENVHTTETSSRMNQRRPETGVASARTNQVPRRPASQQRSRYHAESQRPWSHLSAQRASGNGVGIVMEGAIMQPSYTRGAEYHQEPFVLVT